jgi:hypothetical protein
MRGKIKDFNNKASCTIPLTFIKQRATEQNSHQHSHYKICYFLSFLQQKLTFIKLCMSADVLYQHGK